MANFSHFLFRVCGSCCYCCLKKSSTVQNGYDKVAEIMKVSIEYRNKVANCNRVKKE